MPEVPIDAELFGEADSEDAVGCFEGGDVGLCAGCDVVRGPVLDSGWFETVVGFGGEGGGEGEAVGVVVS